MRADTTEAAVVQRIYEMAEGEGDSMLSAWPGLLGTLATWLDAEMANAFLVDGNNRMVETSFLNVETAAQVAYHQHYQFIDPRFRHAKDRLDTVFSDVRVLERKSFERTEIFNDYLCRYGISYSMFVNLEYAPGLIAPQAFFRSRTMRPFDEGDVRRFEAMLPHLGNSLRLRSLVLESRAQRGDLQRVLDAMSVPACVLDGVGGVLCVSRRASQCLAQLPTVELKLELLTSSQPKLAESIRGAVTEAAALADVSARGLTRSPRVVVVERPRQRSAAMLFFPLLRDHTLRSEGGPRARVLMVLHDPEHTAKLDPLVLQQLYGLTPTEAQLAAALAAGHSVLQFALARGSAEQTVRVHLKRVLDKTKTGRQADLVRVLLSGGALQLEP